MDPDKGLHDCQQNTGLEITGRPIVRDDDFYARTMRFFKVIVRRTIENFQNKLLTMLQT